MHEEILKAKDAARLGPETPFNRGVPGYAQGYSPDTVQAGRESARMFLDHMTRQAEIQAEALDVLKRVIPWDLITPRDEEHLLKLFRSWRTK